MSKFLSKRTGNCFRRNLETDQEAINNAEIILSTASEIERRRVKNCTINDHEHD